MIDHIQLPVSLAIVSILVSCTHFAVLAKLRLFAIEVVDDTPPVADAKARHWSRIAMRFLPNPPALGGGGSRRNTGILFVVE